MAVSLESKLKKYLKNIEIMKTPSCLDTHTIGFYIENKLPKGEKMRVEKHISSCVYCLNQLTELKELIYFQRKSVPLPSHLLQKIKSLFPKVERPRKEFLEDTFSSFVQGISNLFTFPVRQWRYATVSVIAASIAVFITLSIRSTEKEFFRIPKPNFTMLHLRTHEKGFIKMPKLDPNSFAQVKAVSRDGRVLAETQGVIIDSQGLIASNLYPLVGANLMQITLKDGSNYQIRNLWKDEEKNIALMKIERKSLPAFPIADLRHIHIGQKILIVAGPSALKKGVESAIVSGLKGYSSRGAGGKIQYIQLASFAAQYTEGALIDQEGKLIGLFITQEKGMNLAAPLKEAITIIRGQKPISISELKNIKFNSEALHYYFKGILARDARRNDEAMEFFKKAIELNPDLEGSHLELGSIYYIKRLYDLEIKEYQEVLRLNPDNTDALFYLGEAYETKGLYDLAIKEYEKVVSLDSEDAEAYYNLGLGYLTQGHKDKALKIYSKLKVLDPGFAEKLKRLAEE
jgi:tetratricopeptide (TPR) repeat protein